MEEAAKLCDKVALLNEGEIVEIGKPSDVCLKYNHKKKIILRLTSGEEMELFHDATSAKNLRVDAGEHYRGNSFIGT